MTNRLPRLGLHTRSLLATVVLSVGARFLQLLRALCARASFLSQLPVLFLEELRLHQWDFSVGHESYLAVTLVRVQHDCLVDLAVSDERQLFLVRRGQELFEWIFVLCLGPMAR